LHLVLKVAYNFVLYFIVYHLAINGQIIKLVKIAAKYKNSRTKVVATNHVVTVKNLQPYNKYANS